MRLTPAFLLAACLSVSVSAATLTPYLVKDLRPGVRNDQDEAVNRVATIGDVLFFDVRGVAAGLWQTDGTLAGTYRVDDGNPQRHVDGFREPGILWNGLVHYPVTTTTGTFLYKTDGTTAGTTEIAAIPRWYGAAPCGDGKLCFAGEWSQVGVTDGTPAGTSILASTTEGYEADFPRFMTTIGKRVFFNGLDGYCIEVADYLVECGELWTTDGTVAGTYRVKDLFPGPIPGAPQNLFASSKGKLFFAAACPDRPGVACAWVSDGTEEGTRAFWEQASDWHDPPSFNELAGLVYFPRSDGDVFATDGTTAGTFSLRDRLGFRPSVSPRYVGTIHGRMLLRVVESQVFQLWSYDGSTAEKIGDFPPFVSILGELASTGLLYFAVGDGHTESPELWSTDGTAAGTRKLYRLPFPRGPLYGWPGARSRLYYATGRGEIFTANETEAHAMDLTVPRGESSSLSTLAQIGDRIYFRVPYAALPLVATDGTEAGTNVVAEATSEVFEHGGLAWFHKDGQLFKTDGTAAGTVRVSDWLGVRGQFVVTPPGFIGEKVIFASSDVFPFHLTRRDGDGTIERLGPKGTFTSMTGVAGGVVFWHDDRSVDVTELMFTDGTKEGTRALTSGVDPRGDVISAGTRAFFGGTKKGSQTLSLWFTDFTVAGTRLVKDLSSGSGENLHAFLVWRDRLIFTFGLGDSGAVWCSDGTSEGTFQLNEQSFDAVFADGDRLTLIRYVTGGYEVWTSDGTAAGTRKEEAHSPARKAGKAFLMPGGGVGVPFVTTAYPDEIFVRNTRTKELTAIDVTAFGTVSWGQAAYVGGRYCFPAYRASTGIELWAASLDGAPPAETASVSVEFRGTASTGAGRAAIFRVSMHAPGASIPRVVATTVDGTLTSQRDYIPVTREIVFTNDYDVILAVPLRDPKASGTMGIVLSAPMHTVIEKGLATGFVSSPWKRRSARP